jgi:methylenetetrahydrofolate dehydrogenase (NADP+)/methenyltetrahydrofolate cyclohydrolase
VVAFRTGDAVIVQLPLPEGVNQEELLNSIPVEKDADVLSRAARERFEKGEEGALLPPVVGAIREILQSGNVAIAGKRAVVIGAGFLVGGPVAKWLRQQGADVEVLTIESSNEALVAALAEADIIVSGTGSPGLIMPDMIKQGLALIDAGTSESNGKIVGDADPACADKCSLFTPVPGGVGPIAVACLFENAVCQTRIDNASGGI